MTKRQAKGGAAAKKRASAKRPGKTAPKKPRSSPATASASTEATAARAFDRLGAWSSSRYSSR